MARTRADKLLVERGLAQSRSQAQHLIATGLACADGKVINKSSSLLADKVKLEIKKEPRFVSRGGDKLEAALTGFGVNVTDKVCADVGASTGGFTDCLLNHGAAKVYAIDVGKRQLDGKLRQDARVFVMEETNARYLQALPEMVDLITIDASFISLKILIPKAKTWLQPNGELIALIKPQFEAGKSEAKRGKGVIRNHDVHRRVLEEIVRLFGDQGFGIRGLMRSPILGPKGNIEFLIWGVNAERSIDTIQDFIVTI